MQLEVDSVVYKLLLKQLQVSHYETVNQFMGHLLALQAVYSSTFRRTDVQQDAAKDNYSPGKETSTASFEVSITNEVDLENHSKEISDGDEKHDMYASFEMKGNESIEETCEEADADEEVNNDSPLLVLPSSVCDQTQVPSVNKEAVSTDKSNEEVTYHIESSDAENLDDPTNGETGSIDIGEAMDTAVHQDAAQVWDDTVEQYSSICLHQLSAPDNDQPKSVNVVTEDMFMNPKGVNVDIMIKQHDSPLLTRSKSSGGMHVVGDNINCHSIVSTSANVGDQQSNESTSQYACPICNEEFSTNDQLINHKKKYHAELFPELRPDGQFKKLKEGVDYSWKDKRCLRCNKTFKLTNSLRRHLLTHTGDFACKICGVNFDRKERLENHLERHESGEAARRYKCELCKSTFSREDGVIKHMKVMHDKKYEYICVICDKDFSCQRDLAEHIKAQHKNKTYTCERCGALYRKAQLYQHHVRMCGTDQATALTCDSCGKRFQSMKSLNQHQAIHSKPKYTCEKCGVSFRWTGAFTRHKEQCSGKLKKQASKIRQRKEKQLGFGDELELDFESQPESESGNDESAEKEAQKSLNVEIIKDPGDDMTKCSTSSWSNKTTQPIFTPFLPISLSDLIQRAAIRSNITPIFDSNKSDSGEHTASVVTQQPEKTCIRNQPGGNSSQGNSLQAANEYSSAETNMNDGKLERRSSDKDHLLGYSSNNSSLENLLVAPVQPAHTNHVVAENSSFSTSSSDKVCDGETHRSDSGSAVETLAADETLDTLQTAQKFKIIIDKPDAESGRRTLIWALSSPTDESP